MEDIKKLVKNYLPVFLLKKLYDFLNLVKTPNNQHSVTSDQFPYKITDGWDTYFELLNLPAILDPLKEHQPYNVKFIVFNNEGSIIYQFDQINNGMLRNTINISEKLRLVDIKSNGTFACFHECYLPWLKDSEAFLAERGYVGYQNTKISQTCSYVHGNFDAISKDSYDNLKCLGTASWKKRIYNLQYEFTNSNSYELAFVNSTKRSQVLKIERISRSIDTNTNTLKIKIPSRGIYWLKQDSNIQNTQRIVINSNINLARPVVFRLSNNNFDVFHG
jgi:hypothetical protein